MIENSELSIVGILISIIVILLIAGISIIVHLYKLIRRANSEISNLTVQGESRRVRLEECYRDLERQEEENEKLKQQVVRAVNLLKSKVEDYELALEFERLKNSSK